MRAPREMYERFLSAHARAEALVGLTPELRCNRAHGWHMFERRLPEALAEFRQVLDEDPTLGPAYVRLTMLYATLGRLDDALDTVHRAYAVDPLLPLLPATDVFVRFWRREFDEAMAVGAKAVELHPFLQLGRAFYAQALEFSGRLEEALAQYQIGSVMSPELSWLRALQGACLVKMRPRRGGVGDPRARSNRLRVHGVRRRLRHGGAAPGARPARRGVRRARARGGGELGRAVCARGRSEDGRFPIRSAVRASSSQTFRRGARGRTCAPRGCSRRRRADPIPIRCRLAEQPVPAPHILTVFCSPGSRQFQRRMRHARTEQAVSDRAQHRRRHHRIVNKGAIAWARRHASWSCFRGCWRCRSRRLLRPRLPAW